jgi:hypothetical protein
VLPHMRVWCSVRDGGDTKTETSRRTLALPQRAVIAPREQHDRQTDARRQAGPRWADHDLVFFRNGTALDSANVRRGLRNIAAAAGLDATAMNRVFPVVRGRSYSVSHSPRPQTAKRPGPELR